MNQNELKNHQVPTLKFADSQRVLFLDLDETLIHTEQKAPNLIMTVDQIAAYNQASATHKFISFDSITVNPTFFKKPRSR